MEPKLLVLGVGNILLTDEGLGVRALEQLQAHYDFSADVLLLDGGTLGIRLMQYIMDCTHLLVIDAVLGGGAPGTLYRLTGEDLRKSMTFRDSMHQTDLVDTLILCELAGQRPETVVIGMQPQDFESPSTELSPAIASRIPAICAAVLDEIRNFGGTVQEKENSVSPTKSPHAI